MASAAQAVANRINAQPYDAFLQSLIKHHKPASEHERIIVERFVQARRWLQRCYAVERTFRFPRPAGSAGFAPALAARAATAPSRLDASA